MNLADKILDCPSLTKPLNRSEICTIVLVNRDAAVSSSTGILLPFKATSFESLIITPCFFESFSMLLFAFLEAWFVADFRVARTNASWTAPVRAPSLPPSSLEVGSPSLLLSPAPRTSKIHVSNPAAERWRAKDTCANTTPSPIPNLPPKSHTQLMVNQQHSKTISPLHCLQTRDLSYPLI